MTETTQPLKIPGPWPEAMLPADGWWVPPRRVVTTIGVGLGAAELTAFDKALLQAGVGDLNLIKVTSVLPPAAEIIETGGRPWICPIPPGALVPVVYGAQVGEGPLTVAAAVGLGIPADAALNGMIFEASLPGRAAEAEAAVRRMVAEAFEMRGRALREIRVAAVELDVPAGAQGCAFAGVVFLPTAPNA